MKNPQKCNREGKLSSDPLVVGLKGACWKHGNKVCQPEGEWEEVKMGGQRGRGSGYALVKISISF